MLETLLIQEHDQTFDLYVTEEAGRLVALTLEERDQVEKVYEWTAVKVVYKRPGWLALNQIEELSTKPTLFGMAIDESVKSRHLMRYLLRSIDLPDTEVKIELDTDDAGRMYVKNFDTLFGDEGIDPVLVNKIDMELRLRCNV